MGSKETNDNKSVIRWTYSQDMEVQIPIQISQQLRDPTRILHKNSIIYIHFIKGCWYQIGIFVANTLVEYILQARIYQENMEKCEKYKADGYADWRQN